MHTGRDEYGKAHAQGQGSYFELPSSPLPLDYHHITITGHKLKQCSASLVNKLSWAPRKTQLT
jgi:hypothetical protein